MAESDAKADPPTIAEASSGSKPEMTSQRFEIKKWYTLQQYIHVPLHGFNCS